MIIDPHRNQSNRALLDEGMTKLYAFVNEYAAVSDENLGVLYVTFFSDKAHFHLVSYINKQNSGFWTLMNPVLRPTVANTLHPQRATV